MSLLEKAKSKPLGDSIYHNLDIDLLTLKSNLHPLGSGVVLATLFVDKLSETNLYPPSMSMPNATARPTFPLSPSSADLDHSFPQIDTFNINVDESSHGPTNQKTDSYAWVLDFTDRGKHPGVVMSQSRMKAIELVVNPLGGGDGLNGVTDILSFGNGSWIDLLVSLVRLSSLARICLMDA